MLKAAIYNFLILWLDQGGGVLRQKHHFDIGMMVTNKLDDVQEDIYHQQYHEKLVIYLFFFENNGASPFR